MSRIMRKRRANSDSELTLLDSLTRQVERKSNFSFEYDIPMMGHTVMDDINIDILGDSSADHQLFSGDSTMDPSQMFVVSTNSTDSIFSCSSPMDTMESTTNNISVPVVESTTEPTSILNSSPQTTNISTIFPTQLFFFNTGVVNNAPTLFISNPNQILEPPKDTKPKVKPIKKKKLTSVAPKKNAKVEKEKGENKINKQWINDTTDMKKKGCKWKSGLWGNDEEQLLRNNIDNYCKKMNIADPIKMIYFTPKEDRKEFYRSISTGINRPLFTIYRKVLRIYDSKNYVGKYSPDEVEKLEKLNQICPNDWKSIGLMLGRSASSVKDRARLIKPKNKRGRWNETELIALSKAIRELTKTKVGESVTDGINWVKVAQKITTRTSKQCRWKWLTYLNWKEAGGKEWVKYDEVDLINRIVKLDVADESKINWNKVANGWGSVRSPQWLREKWWQIKKTLPNYQTIKFSELLEQLQNVYIPQLLEKIQQDIDGTLVDSKTSPLEVKGLPSIPNDISDFPDYFERSFPMTQYELQLLMNGEQNQRVLNILPESDLINDSISLNQDVPISSKSEIDNVDNSKIETSLSSLSSTPCEFQLTSGKLKADYGNQLKTAPSLSRDITFDCDELKSLTETNLLDNDSSFTESSTVSSGVSMNDVCSSTASSGESGLFAA